VCWTRKADLPFWNADQENKEKTLDDSTRAIILMVLILLLLMAVALVLSRVLLKRAISRVIKNFRDKNALNPAGALSAEELGFKSRGLLQFGMMRDYKPMALQLLMRGEIVQQTEDGRLFLSEDRLSQPDSGIRPNT
jgi:hypothetical protein